MEEMLAGKSGRAATGSPQPPPDGGLLLSVASPSARLRADLGRESPRAHLGAVILNLHPFGHSCLTGGIAERQPHPLGCGLPVLTDRKNKELLVGSEARNLYPNLRALRRLLPEWAGSSRKAALPEF